MNNVSIGDPLTQAAQLLRRSNVTEGKPFPLGAKAQFHFRGMGGEKREVDAKTIPRTIANRRLQHRLQAA